ncbi:TetR/AcrR family transcriptional regulator [Lactococcus termiticola]|uniref:AcrR family transcriptional regulator n=1 Tax=Lactococcus termiticola TaxID=2169526 RepID=A0A2R5HKE6_9LACT|nr:TetR/AcrR family transcriptional regulator [Lactococcus termiticola]GBG97011.1 AcrR family transcriptional regulator [Lactococcus termiticola]
MAATEHAEKLKLETKAYLCQSLLELLEEKELAKISISQLCQRAGVSRMAFYRQFQSLDEVLLSYFEDKISATFSQLKNDDNQLSKLQIQEQFFLSFETELLLAQQRGFMPLLEEIFSREIKAFFKGQVDDELWLSFVSAGTFAVWRDWILSGKGRPIGEVHDSIGRMVK